VTPSLRTTCWDVSPGSLISSSHVRTGLRRMFELAETGKLGLDDRDVADLKPRPR
jgi:hypothetical protein